MTLTETAQVLADLKTEIDSLETAKFENMSELTPWGLECAYDPTYAQFMLRIVPDGETFLCRIKQGGKEPVELKGLEFQDAVDLCQILLTHINN